MKYIKIYSNEPGFYDEILKLQNTKNFRFIDIINEKSTNDYFVFSCEGDEREIDYLNIRLKYEIFYD